MKLLLLSPHFAPTNAPDMQRIRLLLPHLRGERVEATVLAVSPDCVDFPKDEWLSSSLSPSQEIHRVRALGDPWRKIPGLGSLSTRSYRSLKKRGNELLDRGDYDLVYFSTTQFGIHLLGPYWKSRYGVPFVMDFQDPWVNDYYRDHPAIVPPGGRLKFAAADRFNRIAEPRVIRVCSGITSVSPSYPRMLQERYPQQTFQAWSESDPCEHSQIPTLTIPFPFENEGTPGLAGTQSIFDPNDGCEHWLYTGRCSDSMEVSLRAIFDAFSRIRTANPSRFDKVQIHFVGTQYHREAASDSLIARLARQYRLEDRITEHPDRIPYSEALQCLDDADLLLVPGSDDPGYSASKIFPYLLSQTPVLLVFHEESLVVRISEEAGGGIVIPFREGESTKSISQRIQRVFDGHPESLATPLNFSALEKYSAASQARTLARFLRHCRDLFRGEKEQIALSS